MALVVAAAVVARLAVGRARRGRRAPGGPVPPGPVPPGPGGGPSTGPARGPLGLATLARASQQAVEATLGVVGLIAMREVKERVRGRIFRLGTLFMLLAVGAAIVVPTLGSGHGPARQVVGVVGPLPVRGQQLVRAAASRDHDAVSLVPEPGLAEARSALRSGRVGFVIVDGDQILVERPVSSSGSPADPALVRDVATYLGVLEAYRQAGLSARQVSVLDGARPVAVRALEASSKAPERATSVIGLVLLFFMLTQYNTWILIGVMQEKSSRVVEVLLATVRPLQLLGGKVLGIGLVALGQAGLIAGFSVVVAEAVGSNLLRGMGALVLLSELLWLVLGYAFYCWAYAAAGSTAERQDQVQSLALPLSLPVLLGYIYSIAVASSGNADLLFKVLAYLPPTAPFCMSVLVSLHQATWWEFTASALVSLAGTVAMAVLAANIYRRAVLRTGARVHLRDVLARAPR